MLHIILLLATILINAAHAEIYRWTDQAGNMHVTDDPGKIPDAHKKEIIVTKEPDRIVPLEKPAGITKKVKTGKIEKRTVVPQPSEIPSDLAEAKKDSRTESPQEKIDTVALERDLQNIWDGMKRDLAAKNIDGAVQYFTAYSRDTYRQNFFALKDHLPTIVSDMGPMRLVEIRQNMAICDLRTVRDGQIYSFQVTFIREGNGEWKIYNY